MVDQRSFLIFAVFVLLCIFIIDIAKLVRSHLRENTSVEYCEADAIEPITDVRLFLLNEMSDINSASMEELVLVPGIGEKSAQKILHYRQQFGFIIDMDELLPPCGPLDSRSIILLKRYFKAIVH